MGGLRRWLPGLLVAATGVGAGDLITASLAGSTLGLALLWAAVAGALLKWVLNEGLARWQLGSGETLLEGWVRHFGTWLQWSFLVYLLLWSFVVGGALMSACGVGGTGLWAIGSPDTSKIVWGVVHSLVGLALVRVGGFRVFEIGMSVCIGLMFVTVIATAVLVEPEWGAVGRGLVGFEIPEGGVPWLLGLIGGVGGTVTLLSYGYWIREHGREGAEGVRTCRLDLGLAYALTALFGVAMVIIGSRIEIEGGGAGVAVALASQLEEVLGTWARWLFLFGFWGAVFSSLLGVWQGVPYIFADFMALRRGDERSVEGLTRTPDYRRFQVALATVPMVLLLLDVPVIQLSYAVLGALFMPLLAATLLVLNTKRRIGEKLANGPVIRLALFATLAFFLYAGARQIAERF